MGRLRRTLADFRPTPLPAWRVAHDEEQMWRARGEQAIRDEMEARLVRYFSNRMRFAHRAQRRLLAEAHGEIEGC